MPLGEPGRDRVDPRPKDGGAPNTFCRILTVCTRPAINYVGHDTASVHSEAGEISRRMATSTPPETLQMGQLSGARAPSTPNAALAVLRRPELFIPFLSTGSLGALSACAAQVRGALRDGGAWRMLAKSRGLALASSARALELDAIAQIKAQQSGRHWLATHFTSNPPLVPAPTFAQLDTGFTFFLRVISQGNVLWEGDVGRAIHIWGEAWISFDLSGFWSDVSESWDAMRDFLSVVVSTAEEDVYRAEQGYYSVLHQLEFVVVAVRDLDQAKFCLGRFAFHDCTGSVGSPEGVYIFRPTGRNAHLRADCEMEYRTQFELILETMHDPDGGCVVGLEIHTHVYSRITDDTDPDGWVEQINDIAVLTDIFNELADRVHYNLGALLGPEEPWDLDHQEYARTGAVVSHPIPFEFRPAWTTPWGEFWERLSEENAVSL